LLAGCKFDRLLMEPSLLRLVLDNHAHLIGKGFDENMVKMVTTIMMRLKLE